MKKLLVLALIVVFILVANPCWPDIPHLINYQGMLTDDGGVPLNGSYDLTFSIYSISSGGSALWDETHNDVLIEDGLFSVILGSTESIPSSVFEGAERYLGIKVDTDPELTPRIRLTSVGYAYLAETAISDGDWTVSGDNIYSTVSGNVGIGAAPPAEKLDVAGTVKMSGFKMASGASAGYVLTSDGSGVGTWQAGATGEIGGSGTAGYVPKFTSSTAIGNSAIYQSGSNIGVGTTSPAAKLEVYYDNTNFNSATIAIDNGTGPATQDVLDFKFGRVTKVRIRKANTGDLFIGTEDDKAINLQTNATNRMIVTNTGDVGIRTTSPDAVLDVYGTRNISGSSDGIVNIGNSSSTHVTLDNNEIHGRNGSSSSDLYLNFYGGDVLIAQQGNAGIGTANPNSKLHVNGSVAVSYKYVTSNYTATSSDCVIAAGGGLSDIYIYLPNATSIPGRIYTIKQATGLIDVIIDPYGSQTIDGASTYSLPAAYYWITLISNGSNWWIIGKGP
ncbi:MAG: hypothetical protein WAV05_03440 [Anaerolineales bacterium]